MPEFLKQPWPWYIAGPLIGLMVPALLLIGNRSFGISSNLRHICAACFPQQIPFFNYDWKKETWNLFLVAGVLIGGLLVLLFMQNPSPIDLNPKLIAELNEKGVTDVTGLMPAQLFNWDNILSAQGIILTVVGGFLVGFGTRYAGGCTSGHTIMGLSTLQWPSLVATMSFMAGGFLVANFIIPFILNL